MGCQGLRSYLGIGCTSLLDIHVISERSKILKQNLFFFVLFPSFHFFPSNFHSQHRDRKQYQIKPNLLWYVVSTITHVHGVAFKERPLYLIVLKQILTNL